MTEVKEHHTLTLGHIPHEVSDVLARVDRMDDGHPLVALILQLEDEGKLMGLRCKKISAARLHAKSRTPPIGLETLRVFRRIKIARSGARPAHNEGTGDLDTVSTELPTGGQLIQVPEELLTNKSIHKERPHRVPPAEISREQRTETKARLPKALDGLISRHKRKKPTPTETEIIVKGHCILLPVTLVQVRERHGYRIQTPRLDKPHYIFIQSFCQMLRHFWNVLIFIELVV